MQFGLYQLGDIRFGEGSYYGVDPGTVAGFNHTRTPGFRTFVVPPPTRRFVVPASDRYNELQARFDNLVISSKLDYQIDWRAWLQGDTIFSSVWTDVRGGVIPLMVSAAAEEGDDPPPREPFVPSRAVSIGDTAVAGLAPVTAAPPTELPLADDELPVTEAAAPPVSEDEAGGEAGGEAVSSAQVHTAAGDFEESIALSFDETRVTLGVTSVFYLLTGNRTVTLTNSITTLKGRRDDRTVILNSGAFRESVIYEQDPDAVLDYLFDFSGFLEPGERLLERPGFYHTPGLRIYSRVLNARNVVVFVGGGATEVQHEFTVGVRTSLGKILYGRIGLLVVNK